MQLDLIQFATLPPPFNLNWLGVWLFALMGGLASAFIKIGDIDKRLLYPFIAKPLIGTTAGLAIAIFMNGDTVPPPPSLMFWAVIGSVFLTPIVTGILVFISDQNRQNDVYESVKDKYLPFTKKKGGDDDTDRS